MKRTRIKICGITRPDDAVAAARAGVDAIGIVFYSKVKRYVPVERAREILAALPPFVTPVGLFVNAPVEEVSDVAGSLNLRHVQLHGHETPDQIARLKRFTVIKAVRVAPETVQAELNQWRNSIRDLSLTNLRGFVLETATAGAGGTGVENDWTTMAALNAEGLGAVIAAGGLRPDNVGAVVRRVRPFAVDVSSGVEEGAGKSVEKIERFVQEVEAADRII